MRFSNRSRSWCRCGLVNVALKPLQHRRHQESKSYGELEHFQLSVRRAKRRASATEAAMQAIQDALDLTRDDEAANEAAYRKPWKAE